MNIFHIILFNLINYVRTATVIANKDSHLAVLTRESFQNILSAHYDKLINENLEFLKSLPLFKNWSMAAMEQLYHQFQITEYRKNDIIYKENEPSKNFYFIKIGEVEVKNMFSLTSYHLLLFLQPIFYLVLHYE